MKQEGYLVHIEDHLNIIIRTLEQQSEIIDRFANSKALTNLTDGQKQVLTDVSVGSKRMAQNTRAQLRKFKGGN